MANELQCSFRPLATVYFLVRTRAGLIWNGAAFESYLTANYTAYPISAGEQGSASGFYTANMSSSMAGGVYSVVAKQQLGASPAESDPTIATGDIQWNGSNTLPLFDLATSGQVGQIGPIRLARGTMIQNFPIYLKSSADHVTPFVSGIVSGQISRDGGVFGALQSGAFTELGLGFYSLQALTSGDLLANAVALRFSANGVSGGQSDPLPISIVLQRTSGQAA